MLHKVLTAGDEVAGRQRRTAFLYREGGTPLLPASQAVAYIAAGTAEEVTHLARRLSFVYLATHPVG